MKSTTVAAKEDRKAEEDAWYRAQIARFNKDRRATIKKDDIIRNFLLEKKAQIYDVIAANLAKLKKFPNGHSLIRKITAEEKVAEIENSLRDPQMVRLAEYVKRSKQKVETVEASHLSPSTRRKRL